MNNHPCCTRVADHDRWLELPVFRASHILWTRSVRTRCSVISITIVRRSSFLCHIPILWHTGTRQAQLQLEVHQSSANQDEAAVGASERCPCESNDVGQTERRAQSHSILLQGAQPSHTEWTKQKHVPVNTQKKAKPNVFINLMWVVPKVAREWVFVCSYVVVKLLL